MEIYNGGQNGGISPCQIGGQQVLLLMLHTGQY
jgi:hypothetical protein